MTKISKVKEVSVLDSWTSGDGGQFWPHRYIMEDETQITANHKSLNPFAVGAEVEYEVKGNDPKGNPKGSVGKVKDQNFTPKSDSQPTQNLNQSDAILFQVCLKIAGELHSERGMMVAPSEEVVGYAMKLAMASKVCIAQLKG